MGERRVREREREREMGGYVTVYARRNNRSKHTIVPTYPRR